MLPLLGKKIATGGRTFWKMSNSYMEGVKGIALFEMCFSLLHLFYPMQPLQFHIS